MYFLSEMDFRWLEGMKNMILTTALLCKIVILLIAIVVAIRLKKITNRKELLAVAAAFLLFGILSNLIATAIPPLKDNLTLTAMNQSRNEAKATEVYIESFNVDGDYRSPWEADVGHWYWVNNRYAWHPATDTRHDGSATQTINLKVPVGWERTITFDGNPWRGMVELSIDDQTWVVDTYLEENGRINVLLGESTVGKLILNQTLRLVVYTIILCGLALSFMWVLKDIKSKLDIPATVEEKEAVEQSLTPVKRYPKWSVAVVIGVAGIIVSILAVSNLWGRIKTDNYLSEQHDEEKSTPITAGQTFYQNFESTSDFDGISLSFNTFDRGNTGTTFIELLDVETGIQVEQWELNNQNVENGSIKLESNSADRQLGNSGKAYQLVLRSDNTNKDSAIGTFLQKASYLNGEFLIGAETQDKNLSMGLYCYTDIGKIIFVVVMIGAVLLLGFIFALIFIWKPRFEWIAVWSLIGFGLLYIIIFPAGAVNDSWRHYLTAYEHSNQLLGLNSNTNNIAMRSDDLDAFNNIFLSRQVKYAEGRIETYFNTYDNFQLFCTSNELVESGKMSLESQGDTAQSALSYLPQSIGLAVGRLLSLGAVPCIFLGRLCNLLFVALLLFGAIRIAPTGKEVLLLIILLPMTLQELVAFSYDGVTFAFAILSTAYILRFRYASKSVNIFSMTAFMYAIVGLCACRGGVNVVILAAVITLPRQRVSFKTKAFIFGMSCFTILGVYSQAYLSLLVNRNIVSPDNSLLYGSALGHPIQFSLHIVSSVLENIDTYWGGIFGVRMGWNFVVVPNFVGLLFTVFLIFVCLKVEDEKITITHWDRIGAIVAMLGIVGASFLAMYTVEVEKTTEWAIWGVHGRYVLAILPIACCYLKSNNILLKKNIRAELVFAFCSWQLIEIFYLLKAYITR